MKYTIELVNNRPQCKVATLDRKFFILEDYELFQLMREIETDRNYRDHSSNTKNLFLKNTKMNISVLFKDYDELYIPLIRLYNKFMKQEVKEQKIQSIKTKAALVVVTSGLVTATLLQQFNDALDHITRPSEVIGSSPTIFEEYNTNEPVSINGGELTIESNEAYFQNKSSNQEDIIHEELTITPRSEYTESDEVKSETNNAEAQEPETESSENNLVSVDMEAIYDKGINARILNSAIGYKELYSYFKGNISYEESVELIKRNSRRYAKRQYTFFNHQFNIKWFNVDFDDFNKTVTEVANYIDMKKE